MNAEEPYARGELERRKFRRNREAYYAGLDAIKSLDYSFEDLVHHFPCFVGHLTLARFLALYECYKQTLGVAGHAAEVGVFRGASLLWIAKLIKIFEPGSLTQVHGFDWFKGMDSREHANKVAQWAHSEPFERVRSLIEAQGLGDLALLHRLDAGTELGTFFERHPHLQFKIVFLDAGTEDVVRASLEHFWPRITRGGVLILDQFNHELSPGETAAVKELLPGAELKTFPWAWMPTAYVVK